MSEQYFLEKCILVAEDAKSSFSSMENLNVEPEAKQMYKDMVSNTGAQLQLLKNRLKYLEQMNTN